MTPRPLRCVVSISGIRGIVGTDLDPDQILALAAAFAGTLPGPGPVVLGRDSRPTGEALSQAVAAGLRGAGRTVIDIGVVPTPTVPIMVLTRGAAGGIQISASHNPVAWNALKFFNHRGRNVTQTELDAILAAYGAPPADQWRPWQDVGGYSQDPGAIDIHIGRILAIVDADRIRRRGFTVLIDSVNGAGSRIAPQLLAQLGCRVVPVHTRPDLVFPRDPEPTKVNLRATSAMVAAAGADLGLVQDPDADRLAIIDEHGTYIGEEYTLVLCAWARLLAGAGRVAGGSPQAVCTNLSTSRMLEDVAKAHHGRVVRSRVGEANVVDAMEREQALIGGEGNGGVIDPRVVMGRDSQAAMALVLELLATTERPLSALIGSIPRYAMHKEKVAMDHGAVALAMGALRNHPVSQGAEIVSLDGIKLIWADRWVHLRASGTEPASRIIAEAPTEAEAERLAVSVRQAVGTKVLAGHGPDGPPGAHHGR